MNRFALPLLHPALRATAIVAAVSSPLACDLVVVGEGDGGASDDDEESDTGDNGDTPPPEPVCTEPAEEVLCRDQSLVALNMTPEDSTPGDIVNEQRDGYIHSTVDATAGGFNGTQGFVYGRFTDDGLAKVELTDDASFDSMEWDISFRRYVMRLNSGTGGPSCVTGARTAPGTDFTELDSVPAGVTFNSEEFMTAGTCQIIADGSGLPSSPTTVLQNYWNYQGCLKMTGNVYVLELASGRHVKLTVTHYYNEAAQEECNEDGTTTTTPTGSGTLQLDWAFID